MAKSEIVFGELSGGASGPFTVQSPALVENTGSDPIVIDTGLSEVKHFILNGHQGENLSARIYLEVHTDGFQEDNTMKCLRYTIHPQLTAVYSMVHDGSTSLSAATYAVGFSISGGTVTILPPTSGWRVFSFSWYAG